MRARTHESIVPYTSSADGDTENGRSGIEARLIVLDNSGASADATIPGRCWPGLADWLAGSRGCSLSLSFILPCSLSPFLSLSFHPYHSAGIPHLRPVPSLSLFLFRRATLSFLRFHLWLFRFTIRFYVIPFYLFRGVFLKMTRHFPHLKPRRFCLFRFFGLSGVSSLCPSHRCLSSSASAHVAVFRVPCAAILNTGGSPPPRLPQWSRCRGRRPGVCFRRSKLLIEKMASSRGTNDFVYTVSNIDWQLYS